MAYRNYLRNLSQRKKKDLKRIFPGADKHSLGLITQILKFDVEKRISIKDALQHSYFKQYRDNMKRTKTPKGYENILYFQDIELPMKQYRSLILEEVLKYNKEEQSRFKVYPTQF